jgi:hypothetical protein
MKQEPIKFVVPKDNPLIMDGSPRFEEMLVREQMEREMKQRHRVLVREREDMSYYPTGGMYKGVWPPDNQPHPPYSELTRTREMTPTEYAISKLDTNSPAVPFTHMDKFKTD